MNNDHWLKILPPDSPEQPPDSDEVLRMLFGADAVDIGEPRMWTFTPKQDSPDERDN